MRIQRTILGTPKHLAAIAMLLFPTLALAAAADSGINLSSLRHQSYNPNEKSIKIVRIEGMLKCDLGAENTGNGCNIQIMEDKTGKMFRLIEASRAMRLYQDGIKKAAIEGTLTSPDTISVRKAETL